MPDDRSSENDGNSRAFPCLDLPKRFSYTPAYERRSVPFLTTEVEGFFDMNGTAASESITIKVQTILYLKKIVGAPEIEISVPKGCTLQGFLEKMVNTRGDELTSHLFKPNSTEILPHLRLMINGRDIGFLDGMKTELRDGDEILILPPVSGG
jgi:molybdopterin synthase sulfur carrier subunit